MVRRKHDEAYARRKAKARAVGFASYTDLRRHGGSKAAKVHNDVGLFRLPRPAREERRRSFSAVSEARTKGMTLNQGARRNHTSVEAIKFWVSGVVRPDGSVTEADRLWRPMWAVDAKTGHRVAVDVRGSRAATRLSDYAKAVDLYLETGDDSELRGFEGVRLAGVELETDPDVIDRLAMTGELSYESIYRDVAA